MYSSAVNWWVGAVYSSALVSWCCVQLCSGELVLCTALLWWVGVVYSSTLVSWCCVQLYSGELVLCTALLWWVGAVYSSTLVSWCCVQLYSGELVLCTALLWWVGAVYSSTLVSWCCAAVTCWNVDWPENNVAEPKADKCLSSTSHFSLFNNVLGFFCSLTKRDYPQNWHVLFCPNKQLSFQPFMCGPCFRMLAVTQFHMFYI